MSLYGMAEIVPSYPRLRMPHIKDANSICFNGLMLFGVCVFSKWKLISHPLSINPFPASMVNYSCKVQLLEISVNNQTFIEFAGMLLAAYCLA